MEGGYIHSLLLLRTIIVESSKSEVDPTFTSTPPEFDINLKFIFQSFDNNWIIEQDSIRISRTCSAMTEKKLVVSLKLEQFSDYKGTCEILNELLKDWRVLDSSCEIVVDFVWSITRREIMISMVGGGEGISVSLQFHLRTVSHIDDEGDADADAATYVMVSSGDDTIKLLEKKMMREDDGESQRCPICLDDLYDTNISMPCLHVFHADCIKSWLQRSQCCPLCRSHTPIPTWI